MVKRIAPAPIPHQRPIMQALVTPSAADASGVDVSAATPDVGSFLFGAGQQASTPAEAARLRAISAALGQKEAPHSFGTGLSAIGDALVSRKYADDAASAEKAGQASADEAFKSLTGDGSTPTQAQIMQALANPWMNDGEQAVTQALFTQTAAPKTQVVNGKLINTLTGEVVADYGPKESWRPMTTEEKAAYGVKEGDGAAWSINPLTQEVKKEGGNGQTINVDAGQAGSSVAELNKQLGKGEGTTWQGYVDAGASSAGAAQDFQILDQLSQVAPQDPLSGPLLQTFPGLNSAGAAFQSVVKRIAPTLRAPGSGATSDIEYEGMLNSLPSLSNKPEANRVILAMMRNKAEINQQRAEVVMQYQSSPGTAADAAAARQKLQEINRKSLLTPELTAALQGLGVDVGKAAQGAGSSDPAAGGGFGTIVSVED